MPRKFTSVWFSFHLVVPLILTILSQFSLISAHFLSQFPLYPFFPCLSHSIVFIICFSHSLSLYPTPSLPLTLSLLFPLCFPLTYFISLCLSLSFSPLSLYVSTSVSLPGGGSTGLLHPLIRGTHHAGDLRDGRALWHLALRQRRGRSHRGPAEAIERRACSPGGPQHRLA